MKEPQRPRPCPVCRSAMIAENHEDGTSFRCDDCGCVIDMRRRSGPGPSGGGS